MNTTKKILKILDYDKFKCTADKCKFTCCEGWDISIDSDTYGKWKKLQGDCSKDNVKLKICGDKKEYIINKETYETCPLLDEQGLCQVVKDHGEEYLSLTCHTFPRIENTFRGEKELTLSCACPEVVDIISNISGKIKIDSENDTDFSNRLVELKIRDTIVNIIQESGFSLEHKLLIAFQMLSSILESDDFSKEAILKEIGKYKRKEYILELVEMFNEIEIDKEESIEEITNLFLDIIENYKEVPSLEHLLIDISDFAEELDIESIAGQWQDYKNKFKQQNILVENCMVSKILSSCVSNDIEDMIVSFQLIVLEYFLMRYAVFLKCSMNESENIYLEDIKDYMVVFSRIIGNNAEAVSEFIRDGFDNDVLEIGYLCFISLF